MKFRYYITDCGNGNVRGTDSPEMANDFAQSDEYFVVDSTKGLLIGYDGFSYPIEEMKK